VRSILLDTVTYGPIPQNSGLTRPIKIVAPLGCLANPIFPAPVIARFAGGADGRPSELYHVSAAGQATALLSKVPYRKAFAGDRLVTLGPSGGGYGDPLRRPAEAVLEDVLDGLLSPEMAGEQYGVAIADGRVDGATTARLRRAAAG
jgi:N-methylhydantoinase B/oxoprolinase/acetone carboxylase alpha subunit